MLTSAIPEKNIELTLEIKEDLAELQQAGKQIEVHWCPGHKNIEGNELADKTATEAAQEASSMEDH